MYKKVKSCKPNVMKTYNHHGSHGSCFSFGKKTLYGMVENISVGVYSNKRSKVELRQHIIDSKAEDMETLRSEVIKPLLKTFICVINHCFCLNWVSKTN